MPKLRMKDSHGADEAVLRATKRAEKRAKREARRKARDASYVEEPVTPPRSHSHPQREAGEHPLEGHDWGFDESSVPPERATKRSRTGSPTTAAVDDEAAFNAKLREANAQDEGIGFYEDVMYERQPAGAFAYDSAAARAMGVESEYGAMDDEEYAEYIRAGMWRLRNKEELARRERLEKERKERIKREEEELDRLRKEEARRIRKLEENARKKNVEFEKEERRKYQEKWDALTASLKVAGKELRYTDFPWPLMPPAALPPLSWPAVDEITSNKIEHFLLMGSDTVEGDDKGRKQNLRTAILAYHPDRFERYILKIPEDKPDLRERVRAIALRVSQVLNDIAKS